MAQPLRDPVHEFRNIANWFLTDTLRQLEQNTQTQRIYPVEVYKGYTAINAARGKRGQWHSEGKGYKSFKGTLVNGTPEGWTYEFSFLDHMRFVDMGVGLGTKLGDVDSAKKANYKSRYIKQWDRYRKGHSQRPAIMMELRHLQTRMQNHLTDFYGYVGEVQLLKAFDGKTIEQMF